MSNEGKSLQDVYDSGSAQLADLEQAQKETFKDNAGSLQAESKDLLKSTSDNCRKKSKELEAAVKAFLNASQSRIQKTIEFEKQETQDLIESIGYKIAAACRDLQASIGNMSTSKRAVFTSLVEDSAKEHGRQVSYIKAGLLKKNYQRLDSVKAQSTFLTNTLQQKLDNALIEVRGEEKLLSNKLFKAMLQNTNLVDSNASQAVQNLAARNQLHGEALSTKFQEAELKLQSHVEAALNGTVEQNNKREQELKSYFEQLAKEVTAHLESQISNNNLMLTESHELACGTANTLWQDLGLKLSSEAEESINNLSTRAAQLTDSIQESINSTMEESQRRCEKSLSLQKSMVEKKEAVLRRVKQDLEELKQSFTQRLEQSVQNTLAELDSICKESQQSIELSQKTCDDELKTINNTSKVQIQGQLAELLKRIKERREGALEEIYKAACRPSETRLETPKKGKKTKKNTSEQTGKADKNGGT